MVKKLLEISRNRWQHQWDSGNTGRNIYKIIPKIRNSPTFWHRDEILFTIGHVALPHLSKPIPSVDQRTNVDAASKEVPLLRHRMPTYQFFSPKETRTDK
ncbi:hypothetical protein AVEN_190217-1 [Araneus ventricosus]|uniref:Uncharacterized protein n=1 Tax=Araneus ventricosus TaxID=182803 RepID=A0A4Y2FHJ8_ARAVE|nr:hypothetical protein AVEN_190217-1 [Araneus ventricosus]